MKKTCRAQDPSTCRKHGKAIIVMDRKQATDRIRRVAAKPSLSSEEATQALKEANYFATSNKPETIARLEAASGKSLANFDKLSAASRQAYEFEKANANLTEADKNDKLQKEHGISNVRHHQALVNNPVYEDARKQVETKMGSAEKGDFIAERQRGKQVASEVHRQLFNRAPVTSTKTPEQAMREFANVEEALEKDERRRADFNNRLVAP
jgi:hypothetical protein